MTARTIRRAEALPEAINNIAKNGYGLDVKDVPQRIQGPWTLRDLSRAEQGKGPIDFLRVKDKVGKAKPLELHHAGQMPGSGIHETLPNHYNIPGIHNNKYNQGVTPTMRKNDRELHWQTRGQEMGNPIPTKKDPL
jgi:hypothetical protein